MVRVPAASTNAGVKELTLQSVWETQSTEATRLCFVTDKRSAGPSSRSHLLICKAVGIFARSSSALSASLASRGSWAFFPPLRFHRAAYKM